MTSFEKLHKLNQWHRRLINERTHIIGAMNAKVTVAQNNHRICIGYPTRTLRLLHEDYCNTATANALYEWAVNSRAEANENETRELIAFGVPYVNFIGKQMLLYVINRTKIAHPRFRYHDLTEMNNDDAAAFRTVLRTVINVYVYRREERWRLLEDADWMYSYVNCWDVASTAFPVASVPLVDLIIEHADRADDIARHILDRQIDVVKKDVSGLKEYLSLDSPALSEGAL